MTFFGMGCDIIFMPIFLVCLIKMKYDNNVDKIYSILFKLNAYVKP